ncbi:MAG: hypothetical protein U5R49_25235 [Deltaproteobacteria bacterium]|nr:hypothetical protein [Deltaproteobacteria bacterium]
MKKLFMKLPDPIKGPILRKRVCIDESKLDGTTFKIADTIEELKSAYGLVHDVYVKEGYMDPHPSGMRVTKYNLLPKSTTFVGKKDGKVVVTISLIPDSENGLPMDSLFKRELDKIRSQGRYIAEVGNLATDPNFRNRNQNVPMHANKIMLRYAHRYLNVDNLVIAINPKHKWLYKNILLFNQISGKKDYDYVKGAPALAMTMDILRAEQRYRDVYANSTRYPPPRNLHHFAFIGDSPPIRLPAENKPYLSMKPEIVSHFEKHMSLTRA